MQQCPFKGVYPFPHSLPVKWEGWRCKVIPREWKWKGQGWGNGTFRLVPGRFLYQSLFSEEYDRNLSRVCKEKKLGKKEKRVSSPPSDYMRKNILEYPEAGIAICTEVPENNMIKSQPLPFLNPPDDILGVVPEFHLRALPGDLNFRF